MTSSQVNGGVEEDFYKYSHYAALQVHLSDNFHTFLRIPTQVIFPRSLP